MSKYQLYVADCETTGTQDNNEIIEFSLLRVSDSSQKTFFIQPTRWDCVQEDALRINGHSLQDLKNGFRIEEDGSKTIYMKPQKALVAIEQFLMEDFASAPDRVLVGQNTQFDIRFLQAMWRSLGQEDTYPFGRMYLDTMQIAFFLDYVNGVEKEGGYNLAGLVKALEVKKEKAHRAENDVRMTKDVFFKLVESCKKNSQNKTG